MFDLYGLFVTGAVVVVVYVTYVRRLREQLRVSFLYGFVGGALCGAVLGVCSACLFPSSTVGTPETTTRSGDANDHENTHRNEDDADEELLRIFGGQRRSKRGSTNYADEDRRKDFTHWFGRGDGGCPPRVPRNTADSAPKSARGLFVSVLRNLWAVHGKHAVGILED